MKTYEVVLMEKNQKFKRMIWIHRRWWESMRNVIASGFDVAKKVSEESNTEVAIESIRRID